MRHKVHWLCLRRVEIVLALKYELWKGSQRSYQLGIAYWLLCMWLSTWSRSPAFFGDCNHISRNLDTYIYPYTPCVSYKNWIEDFREHWYSYLYYLRFWLTIIYMMSSYKMFYLNYMSICLEKCSVTKCSQLLK